MQITDITEVKQQQQSKTETPNQGKGSPAPQQKPQSPSTPSEQQGKKSSPDELICLDLDGASSGVDGLTLDDLNDDDFNPRAGGGGGGDKDEDEEDFDPRQEMPPPQTQVLT